MVKYARRALQEQDSSVLTMLKIAEMPEVISFAGGLPAPESFPVQEISDVLVDVLAKEGAQALQYSSAQGVEKLRQQIATHMQNVFNTKNVEADNILITTGSQQGLDLTGKVFLDEDDVVICEAPTYMAALNAFKAYQPKFAPVESDDDGLIIAELEKTLNANPKAKLIYVIPDYQNPSGKRWSWERKQDFMKLVQKYDIAVVEDAPYTELHFSGDIAPSLKSLDTEGQVIYLGTFSKTFCPGMRLGWTAAAAPVLEKYLDFKQSADLHTASLTQYCLAAYLDKYNLENNIASINKLYGKRLDIMLEAIEKHMPQNIKYTKPTGGLFIWLELPKEINTDQLLDKALEQNVAFVPGSSFFADEGHHNSMRLNFSNMPEDKIKEGIKRLANVIREELA